MAQRELDDLAERKIQVVIGVCTIPSTPPTTPREEYVYKISELLLQQSYQATSSEDTHLSMPAKRQLADMHNGVSSWSMLYPRYETLKRRSFISQMLYTCKKKPKIKAGVCPLLKRVPQTSKSQGLPVAQHLRNRRIGGSSSKKSLLLKREKKAFVLYDWVLVQNSLQGKRWYLYKVKDGILTDCHLATIPEHTVLHIILPTLSVLMCEAICWPHPGVCGMK